jgi:uncharacterized membrane protein
MIPEILATLASGVFVGAAWYVNLVEHPARLSCGPTIAVMEWRPSYKRGTLMQAPLALIGCLSAFLSWWMSGRLIWLAGGLSLLAVLPVTFFVIFPTNKRLESKELDLSPVEAHRLLRLWGRLHSIRSVLSTVAFALFSVCT